MTQTERARMWLMGEEWMYRNAVESTKEVIERDDPDVVKVILLSVKLEAIFMIQFRPLPSIVFDFLDLNIDWERIAEAFLEDVREEQAA